MFQPEVDPLVATILKCAFKLASSRTVKVVGPRQKHTKHTAQDVSSPSKLRVPPFLLKVEGTIIGTDLFLGFIF